MINVSYESLEEFITIVILGLFIVYVATIHNLLNNDYSKQVRDILNKISKGVGKNNVCDELKFEKLCDLQNNLDKVDKDRNNLLKSSTSDLFYSLIIVVSASFYFWGKMHNESLGIKKNNNRITGNAGLFLKSLCLLGVGSGIYFLVSSFNNTKNANDELKLSNEILKKSKNTPIPTGKAHNTTKELNDELISALEKYDKELSSFLNYNYLIIGFNALVLLLIIIYLVKLLLNHKK
tara:strand:+ start:66 stop:773 length:708 start_codon:yes stop_codon:yes gene_type:complete